MTSEVRQLRNFIGGQYVDSDADTMIDIVNPATGNRRRQGPGQFRGRRRPRLRVGGQGLRDLGGGDAERAAAGPAQVRRRHRGPGRRVRPPRGREHRQAARADGVGGGSADGRPAALLRRRRARARGQVGGRVHGRAHLLDPPRADRRRRPGHPVELPDDDGDVEDCPGTRRGQHDRPQAVGHDAGDDAAAGGGRRRVPPGGRRSTSSAATGTPAAGWSSTTRRPWSPSPVRSAPACRSPRARPADSSASTSSSGARRRSSSSTTPTSRPPSRASRVRVTSTLGRTAPPRPASWPVRGSTTTSSLRSPSTPRPRSRSGCPMTTRPRFGPVNNPNQVAHVSGFIDRLPDHARVVAGGWRVRRSVRATSSSRPSSPGCSRRTSRSRTRSSARSSPCSSSPTRTRRWRWANDVAVRSGVERLDQGLRPRHAREPSASTSGASGSTPTSRSSPRCRTGVSSTSGYGKDLSMYGFEDYTRIKHVMANINS